MVAYSFAPMFREPVSQLVKRQTVRGHRKRHAQPGEPLQLFTAMRTKQCRKLVSVDPICTRVREIAITLDEAGARPGSCQHIIQAMVIDGIPLNDDEIEAFAVADGFKAGSGVDARQSMGLFWLEHHGARPFEGVVIEWRPAIKALP